jgi:hypothetical protein
MEAIDFIYYHPRFEVLICKICRSCFQTSVYRHLRLHHRKAPYTVRQLKAYEATFAKYTVISSPSQIREIQPPGNQPPLQFLKVHRDGILCLLCDRDSLPYICRTADGMRHHLHMFHGLAKRRRGGYRRRPAGQGRCPIERLVDEKVAMAPVACQSFFLGAQYMRYFRVSIPDTAEKLENLIDADGATGGSELDLRSQIESNLMDIEASEAEATAARACASSVPATSELARWFQLTEWHRFLEGHSLAEAARLIDIPAISEFSGATDFEDPATDMPLICILESFDRVILRARRSLADGKLNVFDQHQLNSFVPKRSAKKPLFHLLQEASYKKYIRVFWQLLCFVYRRAWKGLGPDLHFRISDGQSLALSSTVQAAIDTCTGLDECYDEERMEILRKRLDDRCLILSISLLDHPLYGDIYDSLVVGFTAVLAIQETHGGKSLPQARLCEAVHYTPHLSAIVKMSQLLVAERALLAVERDEADYPAQALEEMQERFMVAGTRSPICWVQKLRAYGKAIKDTTTSLGRISWSDDGESLTYKTMKLTMTGLRSVVAIQLEVAQTQLAELLLLHPDEDREAVIPPLSLRSLLDNPAESAPGWSFIKHPSNTMLHNHDKWLLNRVLDTPWLRKDFFKSQLQAKWHGDMVYSYLSKVDRFLETLLLLVHMTGGQPARGTELLCVQYCNPEDGQGRRNIFLENGLVSFVTFYHKGYSITGSTKIIHRYLPIEVSELYVYYVWLVVPFIKQLIKLAKLPGLHITRTPYLWGCFFPTERTKGKSKKISKVWALGSDMQRAWDNGRPWPATRLSSALSSEFQRLLVTKVDIQTWRHAAIAISRRHLQQAKFKRDFIEALSWAWNDEMAGHGTTTAGIIYARGLEEAPGHIASAKTEYRRIGREWHTWLGFGGYQAVKK